MTPKKKIQQIHFVWGVLCRLSSVDLERNNISLFDVIDQLNIHQEHFSRRKEGEPLVLPIQCELVTLWRRTLGIDLSDEELIFELKLKLIDPSGKTAQEIVSSAVFQKGARRNRFRFMLNALPISTPGDYLFEIELKDPADNIFKPAAQVPFEVLVIS